MDEPFSAVDPPTRAQLLNDLSNLLSHTHCTTIIVTHYLKEVSQVGDRMAVIINGVLKQTGTPKEIKAKPADKSVKEFLKGL
jgi:ABC-type proline/glycine betaine transport system ATPase subunit